MCIYRVTIANLSPAELAAAGQDANLQGSCFSSLGFGSWGIEPGATAELSGIPRDTLEKWAVSVLEARGEAAAYVTADGDSAWLLWADGRPSTVLD